MPVARGVGALTQLALDALEPGERLIKSIGDAVMLTAPTPVAGVALIRRVCAATDAESGFPVVRAGRHHPFVERDGDLLGATIHLGSRVTAQAGGARSSPLLQSANPQP